MAPSSHGKMVILAGLIATCPGLVMLVAGKIPFPGKLLGDIHVEGPGFRLHVSVITCLLFGLVLTVIIDLFLRR